MPISPEHKVTLGDIKLGASDAEADKKLSNYFVTTPYVSSALELAATQFIGRKGIADQFVSERLKGSEWHNHRVSDHFLTTSGGP
ncbi:hypothetical protein C7446_0516, partial [Kushneria sinocarnis]